LIGAQVAVHEAGGGNLLGTRSLAVDHSYKSGSALEAQFGLGMRDLVDVKVTLPGGRTVRLADVQTDQLHDCNLNQSGASPALTPQL
jgi:hypothetical protein